MGTAHPTWLLKAVHTLKPGQLITGRKKLSQQTGIHESTIQRALKCFENEQMIEQQNLGKYRLITIKNWDIFQATQTGEQDIEQPVNNKRTSPEHHVNTYKNEKNEKNLYINDAYFYSKQRAAQQHDANFEKAKAEFLRRAPQQEKEAAERPSN